MHQIVYQSTRNCMLISKMYNFVCLFCIFHELFAKNCHFWAPVQKTVPDALINVYFRFYFRYLRLLSLILLGHSALGILFWCVIDYFYLIMCVYMKWLALFSGSTTVKVSFWAYLFPEIPSLFPEFVMIVLWNTTHLIDNLSGENMLLKKLKNIENSPSYMRFSEVMCQYFLFLNRMNRVTAVLYSCFLYTL